MYGLFKLQEVDEAASAAMDNSNRNDVETSRSGTDALIEMGVKTGLSLIFSLLRQNWMNTSSSSNINLCNDVLRTSLDVVMSLPPLSLANEGKLPLLGISTLNQVTLFLKGAVMPMSGADNLGKRIASQLVLAIAAQRGSLRYLLEWVEMSLCAASLIEQNKMRKTCPTESDTYQSNQEQNEHEATEQNVQDVRGTSPYNLEFYSPPTENMTLHSPPGKISCDLFVEIVKQMKKTAVSYYYFFLHYLKFLIAVPRTLDLC